MATSTPVTVSLPPLPTLPTSGELDASLAQFIQFLGSLITNYNPGGVADTFLKAICIALGSDASSLGATQPGGYELLTRIQNAAYILTAEGTDLDYKCADVGVTRKAANASAGAITVTVPSGTTVLAGTLAYTNPADPTQQPIAFQVETTTVLAANTPTSLDIECTQTGTAGNVPAGSITVINVAGATCTNPEAVDGAEDTESDTSLRSRGLAAIPNASQCTDAAITNDALSYDGITSAFVLDLTDTDGVTPAIGRAQLYVSDASGNIGNSSNPNYPILVQMQSDFNSGLYRAAGIIVGVHGSTILDVVGAMTIDIANAYIAAGGTEAGVIAAVQLALQVYINALGIGKPIILAELVLVALGVSGVSNVILASVTIQGAAADFFPGIAQSCKLNASTDFAVTVSSDTTGYP